MFFGGSSVHRKDADADSGISLVFIAKAQKTLRLLKTLARLSNTNSIRLLNPSHMHTRSKPPPFFMTLLSNICSSLTHVSPPRRPRGHFLPPPPLHNVQHSEVCKLSQSTHCSALHSRWLSTFHISRISQQAYMDIGLCKHNSSNLHTQLFSMFHTTY